MKESLCWECTNTCGGCSWTKEFKPVEGWTIQETQISMGSKIVDSCIVLTCPKFNQLKPIKSSIDVDMYIKFERFKNFLPKQDVEFLSAYFILKTAEVAKRFNMSLRTCFRIMKKLKSKLNLLELIFKVSKDKPLEAEVNEPNQSI